MNTSHTLIYGSVAKGHNTALAQRAKPSSPKTRHLVAALPTPGDVYSASETQPGMNQNHACSVFTAGR